jgi:thiol-disulfide isomerase/thioredoxin
MRRNLILITAMSLFAQPGLAWAELKVGDPAPSLTIATWVKGEPVSLENADEDEVFVIEFWATWCGPCRTSIPHLSEMQAHFKDNGVTCVGISDENVGVVKKFLESGWDKKMRYTVAVDKGKQTGIDWMKAAGRNGIPCAFVVKGGKIQWIGHPMDKLDEKLAELTKDTEYGKNSKQKKALKKKFTQAVEASEWKKALAAADKLIELDKADFTIRLEKFRILSREMGDAAAARSFGRELIREWERQEDLCQFAGLLLEDKDSVGKKDVKLAVAAAKKAARLSHTRDPVCLRAYAMALAEAGKYKLAVKWQKKAVKLAKGDLKLRAELKKTLKEYEKQLKAEES